MQKIKVRKKYGWWFVLIPGDVPDFSKHRHFTDALAKVFFEQKQNSSLEVMDDDIQQTHESIRRTKVKMPNSLAFKDVLDKAESVLGYRSGKGYKLDQCLAELELEILNHEDVRDYMIAKTRGGYHFVTYSLKEYRLPIPIHALETAIRIKEKLPTVEFTVYNYELDQRAVGDPFLWVSQDGWGCYIEVWDEPEFEGRKTI